MDKRDLERIALEVDKENSLFANKSHLDIFAIPPKIIGREDKAKELARFLLTYKKGHAVPFISIYWSQRFRQVDDSEVCLRES